MEEFVKPRLEVQDKRNLFTGFTAMLDRMLVANEFPGDMAKFALSLWPKEDAAAYKRLDYNSRRGSNLSKAESYRVTYWPGCCEHDIGYNPTEEGNTIILRLVGSTASGRHVFPKSQEYEDHVFYGNAGDAYDEWFREHFRREKKVLRACEVLKHIVTTCNTVGQYKRVSSELVGFLPDIYQKALANYTKTSPYPRFTSSVVQTHLEETLTTLATASLYPMWEEEEDWHARKGWRGAGYYSIYMPQSTVYINSHHCKINI